MALFEKLIQFLEGPKVNAAPVPKRQQPAPRHLQLGKRAYDAALPSALTADWENWTTSQSYETLTAWRNVTNYARDLARNNSHAVCFLRELCISVLGYKGIQCHSKLKNKIGKGFNTKVNATVHAAWQEFRRQGIYEATEQWSGLETDKLILKALARDGGCMIRLLRNHSNKFRFAIQILEVDSLNLYYTVEKNEFGNRVTTGVETNELGKVVAYHLQKFNQQDLFANNYGAPTLRVLAREMIHVWMPDRITAVRGMSWFAPVILKLRMLGEYEMAISVAQRIAASRMGFLTPGKDAEGTYEGVGQDAQGNTIQEFSAGMIEQLPPGYNVTVPDLGHTPEKYCDYRKAMLRTISSGLGIMYNSMGNDLESTSYSSARFGRDQEVEFWRDIQRFYSQQVLNQIFSAWLEMAFLSGNLPGVTIDQLDPINSAVRWKGRGWSYVDPEKDVQAALGAIDGGLSTHRRELEEQGEDIVEVYDELEEEKQMAEERGLVFVNPYSRHPEIMSTQENPEETEAEAVTAGGGKPSGNGKPKPKPAVSNQ